MSSRGSEEPSAGGRKGSAKRRHLACRDCDIPLPDDYEFSRCQGCRPPESDEPTIQDVIIWVKDYVESSLKGIRESLVAPQKPEKRGRTVLSAGEEFQVLDELDSSPSEAEDSARKCHFPLERMQRFLRSIREDVDKGEASASTSTGPTVRAFRVDDTLQKVMRTEWKFPEKAPFFSGWFKAMFPLTEEAWSTVPKVDIAVSKLSRRTVLPCEDGGNIAEPMDRRAESTLRRSYATASAQCSVGVASWEVSTCLRSWLEKIRQDVDDGVPRDDILASFKNVSLAADFLSDAAYQQVKFASRAMALSTAGRRALWLKPWKADVTSKFNLCSLPFEPGRLFGSELDRLMEGLSEKQGMSLPQTSAERPRARRSPPGFRRAFRGQGRRFRSQRTSTRRPAPPPRNKKPNF